MTEPIHPSPVLAELAKKAKSPQTGLFPGNEDPVGFWLTPPELMERFQAEFDFTFDACPYPRPAGFDGTKEPWGTMTYVNPPFEGPRPGFTAWIKKAIAESQQGNGSVLIFPMDGWVSLAINAGATFRPVGPLDRRQDRQAAEGKPPVHAHHLPAQQAGEPMNLELADNAFPQSPVMQSVWRRTCDPPQSVQAEPGAK